MLFRNVVNYKRNGLLWFFGIFNSVLQFGLTEHISMHCRPNVSCTNTSRNVGENYRFYVNGHNLEVFLTNETVILEVFNTLTGLDDAAMPYFENEIRTITLDIQDAKPPMGSFKQALESMNIVYFEELQLFYENFNYGTFLYPRHFEGLKDLQSLQIKSNNFELCIPLDLDFLRPLINLKELKLINMIVPPIPYFTKLNKLVINQGSFYESLQPIGECGNFKTIEISGTDIRQLPEAWLSQCTKLRTLKLENLQEMRMLPDRMLQGVQRLRSLTITKTNMDVFPSDLLSYTPELQKLDLSNNWLSSVPRGFFSNVLRLEYLNLEYLVASFDAKKELNKLPNLKTLVLNGIFKYGICNEDLLNKEGNNTMPFTAVMPKLEYLSLQLNIELTKICPEWSLLFPSLKKLNLTDHRIENLTYKDMQIISSNGWEVDMRSTYSWNDNLKAIRFTESDFNTIQQNLMVHTKATILLNEQRECDCNWYWAIRALKARPGFVNIPNANCTWYDPPGSENLMTTPIVETPESKLVCQIN